MLGDADSLFDVDALLANPNLYLSLPSFHWVKGNQLLWTSSSQHITSSLHSWIEPPMPPFTDNSNTREHAGHVWGERERVVPVEQITD